MKRVSCLKAVWPFNRVPAWDVSLAPKWAVRIQRDFRAVRVNATTMQERVVDGIVFQPLHGNRFACGRVYRVIAG